MIPNPDYTYRAELLSVTDGDTIEVRIDVGFFLDYRCILRLDGIDCPEKKGRTKAAGLAAMAETIAFLGNRRLIVQTRPDPDRKPATKSQVDSFGRWLSKVWAEGREIELCEHLLATHHAVPWTGK